MSKPVNTTRLIFRLLIAFTIVSCIVAYQLNQIHQRQIQTNVLNGNFTKVQLQNGKVQLVPVFLAVHGHNYLMKTSNLGPFDKPMLLSVGSQFFANDRHWRAKYTITTIESDGVRIHFDADGNSPAAVRNSSGTVKLQWK